MLMIGTIIYGGGMEFKNVITKAQKASKIETILDSNKDGKLSQQEIKRFYDETGLSPYSWDSIIKQVDEEYYDPFLSKYGRN